MPLPFSPPLLSWASYLSQVGHSLDWKVRSIAAFLLFCSFSVGAMGLCIYWTAFHLGDLEFISTTFPPLLGSLATGEKHTCASCSVLWHAEFEGRGLVVSLPTTIWRSKGLITMQLHTELANFAPSLSNYSIVVYIILLLLLWWWWRSVRSVTEIP